MDAVDIILYNQSVDFHQFTFLVKLKFVIVYQMMVWYNFCSLKFLRLAIMESLKGVFIYVRVKCVCVFNLL